MYKTRKQTLSWFYQVQYKDYKKENKICHVQSHNQVFKTVFSIKDEIKKAIYGEENCNFKIKRLQDFTSCIVIDQINQKVYLVVQFVSKEISVVRLELEKFDRSENLLGDFKDGTIQKALISARTSDTSQVSSILFSKESNKILVVRNSKHILWVQEDLDFFKIRPDAEYNFNKYAQLWKGIKFFQISQDFLEDYKEKGIETDFDQTMYVRLQDDQKREINNLFVQRSKEAEDGKYFKEFSIAINSDFSIQKKKNDQVEQKTQNLPFKVIEDPSLDPFWNTKTNPLKIKIQRVFDLKSQKENPDCKTSTCIPFIAIERSDTNLDDTKRIFIAVLDTKKRKITDAHQIELSERELKEFKSAQLNASSEIKDTQKGKKQNFQVCVWFGDKLQSFKILEYEITWLDEDLENFTDIDIIGTKRLISQMNSKDGEEDSKDLILNPEFLPLFDKDDRHKIIGTQIVFSTKTQEKKMVRVINLENIDKFQYENKLTKFCYRVYNRDLIVKNKILLVEVKLKMKEEVLEGRQNLLFTDNNNLFNEYDKNQIILMTERAIINTVTFELQKYLWSGNDIDIDEFDYFHNIELLQDEKIEDSKEYKVNTEKIRRISEYHVENSQTIQQEYDWSINVNEGQQIASEAKGIRRQKQFYKCLILIALEKDQNNYRSLFFQEIGLIDTLVPNLGSLETLVDYCCNQKDQSYIQTLEVLFSKILSQSYNHNRNNICSSFLDYIQDIEAIPQSYFKFFNESENMQSITLECSLNDEILPSAQPDALRKFKINPDGETLCSQEIQHYLNQFIISHFKKGSDFQVEYKYLDLRFLIFKRKISMFLQGKTQRNINKISEHWISNVVNKVVTSNPQIIEESRIIRNIIKEQFDRTTWELYLRHALVFIFFAVLPHLIMMHFKDFQLLNMGLSFLVLFVLISYEINELILIAATKKKSKYFMSAYNIFDHLMFFLYVAVFLMRARDNFVSFEKNLPLIQERNNNTINIELSNFTNNSTSNETIAGNNTVFLSQQNKTEDIQLITWDIMEQYNQTIPLRLISSFVLILGFLKILSFTRLFQGLGLQATLIGQSCIDVLPFLLYFIMLIGAFAIQLGEVGATFSTEDYESLPEWAVLVVQTYRNGIGDIAAPDYSYWTKVQVKGESVNQFLLFYIWFGWLSCQFFILIIMLNFIISVISETYARITSQATILFYQQMAELNEEVRLVQAFWEKSGFNILKEFVPKLEQYECLIIQSTRVGTQVQGQTNEWQGQLQAVKKAISNENSKINKKIEDLSDDITKVNDKLDRIMEFIEGQQKQQQLNIEKKINEVLKNEFSHKRNASKGQAQKQDGDDEYVNDQNQSDQEQINQTEAKIYGEERAQLPISTKKSLAFNQEKD